MKSQCQFHHPIKTLRSDVISVKPLKKQTNKQNSHIHSKKTPTSNRTYIQTAIKKIKDEMNSPHNYTVPKLDNLFNQQLFEVFRFTNTLISPPPSLYVILVCSSTFLRVKFFSRKENRENKEN